MHFLSGEGGGKIGVGGLGNAAAEAQFEPCRLHNCHQLEKVQCVNALRDHSNTLVM